MNIGDKVNIKLNDTLWKDKTGTIENIENNTVTVLVDFDDKGHKIRQLFNIDDLTESLMLKEELPVQDGDDLELVADDNAFFKITNGILRGLNVDREDLETVTSINIPSSVTKIGDYAFKYFTSLTSVTIPNSVTYIGEYAFYCCDSLTSIVIPNSVTKIGGGAFESCTSLKSAVISNSVTNIGRGTFGDCKSLKSVVIPNSVTEIDDFAFYSCVSLKSIVIPNSVTKIGRGAFYDCFSLKSIVIPNSTTKIDTGAFYGCSSLNSIVIPNSVMTIGPNSFVYCESLTIYCEVESKPEGWHKAWNPSNRPVVYGYKGKLTEDIEDVENDELELVELDADTSDERLMALAEYFKISPWEVTESDYGYNRYEIAEESDCEAAGETYYVLTDDEADDMAADNFRDLVMGDPIEYMGGVDGALDYIDIDHFQDMMEEDAGYRVDDMSDDDLIEEGLDRDIINFPEDFALLSYVKEDAISELLESHPEYSELSEDELLAKAGEEGIVDLEDRENYELLNERETLDQIRSELIAQYQSEYDDPIEWYIDVFGRQDLEEYVANNTDLIDVDRYVDEIIRYGYDSREYYIGDGSSEIDLGNGYYAFRYE